MSEAPSLVVGLGNPGREYVHTRHNVGFMTVDELCRREGAGSLRSKFSGQFGKILVKRHEVMVLKPETFMNESGRSVQAAASFFHLEPAEVIVVHDELDLPFGEVRIKVGGGHAGHNGLRSIVQCIGTADFVRVRIGIGRPPAGFGGDVAGYVLSGFASAERTELEGLIAKAALAIERVLQVGLARAMNEVNARPKAPRAARTGVLKGDVSKAESGADPSADAAPKAALDGAVDVPSKNGSPSSEGPNTMARTSDASDGASTSVAAKSGVATTPDPSTGARDGMMALEGMPSKPPPQTSVSPMVATDNRIRSAWC